MSSEAHPHDTSADSTDSTDTIAAIATPPGVGGIGIVRVSGPDAFTIGLRIFHPAAHTPADTPPAPPSHLLTYGHVVDPASGERIDEVLAAFMRAPRTYTREDVVEISAHGGPLLLRRILALALASGARSARPGEMTLRAFLNGRLDLAQAEAVMALINAETDAGRRLALRQLQGELSARVRAAHDSAVAALVRIEASIDFPEEEVPQPDPAELAALIGAASGEVERLLAGAGQGRILREGLRVAIVGRPNVGKSSLLNKLLGTERAIVTPIAGTTRDTVEERATIAGIALHLVDTAGLTASDDPIERIGVARSRAAAREADLLLFVLDRSVPLSDLDSRAAHDLATLFTSGAEGDDSRPPLPAGVGALPAAPAAGGGDPVLPASRRPVPPQPTDHSVGASGWTPSQPTDHSVGASGWTPTPPQDGVSTPHIILVLNKSDLPAVLDEAAARALIPGAPVVHTSTFTSDGTTQLEEAIAALATAGTIQPADVLVASARHQDALRRAAEHLAAAATTLTASLPLDFVSIDLRAALDALGEITGETATADLLDRIFSEFCIGK